MFERMLGIALGAGLWLGACGDDADEPKPTKDAGSADASVAAEPARFVGEVADTDVRVAVLSSDDRLRLFFCGGDESYETATRWFNLSHIDERELSFEDDGWRVEATLKPSGVSGTLARDGEDTRDFSALPVEDGTLAGLYEGSGECGRMGLIVSQPSRGAEIRAQGACVGEQRLPQQVNPIAPVVAEAGKIRVHTPGGPNDETSLLAPASLQPL
jgi:hypothetical protein